MVVQTPVEARGMSPLTDGSDARLRALTEHALGIITVQDADGAFTYATKPSCATLATPSPSRSGVARPTSCIPTMLRRRANGSARYSP